MNESLTSPPVSAELTLPPPSKWEREYLAFRHLLPKLLETQRGEYVAVHDGKVVDCGDDKLVLALRVLSKVGNIPIHIGLVSDQAEPVLRSGVRRESMASGGPV